MKEFNWGIICGSEIALSDEEVKQCEKFLARLLAIQSEIAESDEEVAKYRAEVFVQKLERLYPDIEYVNRLMTHSWGQRVVRFYDFDGNLIEVGTPM